MRFIMAFIIVAAALTSVPGSSRYEEPVTVELHERVAAETRDCDSEPMEALVEPVDPIDITELKPILLEVPEVEQEVETDINRPITLTDEEIELIALVTMAEAEGECEEGKRLVIDTILNRVESIYFPNTVYDVVYQPDHFSSMWNERIDKCYVDEDICQFVREEAEDRLNYEVVFFTAGGYGRYGEPMFQVGNHYFGSYD